MYSRFGKRLLDCSLALLALLLLWPLLLLTALLVATKLGRPVLFKQERPGLHGKPFYLYKFRSMTNETDSDGHLLANELRLTRFGRLLRSSSLDELPSLLNVLKGDLSLVGPRPLRMRYLPYFTAEQNLRHSVLPGITGFAQVNGRAQIGWDEKFALDVQYVRNMSFFFDCKILLQTVLRVLNRSGTTVVAGQDFEQPFDEYVKSKGGADA
jgi:sugar transferase EpsL